MAIAAVTGIWFITNGFIKMKYGRLIGLTMLDVEATVPHKKDAEFHDTNHCRTEKLL
jgi:hypothetical protein